MRVVLYCLMQISAEFRQLLPGYRQIISDICQRMGRGMIVYYLRSPGTLEEWNEVLYLLVLHE